MKSYKPSTYKPFYMVGFLVMAFSLTSFNPTNVKNHLAQLEPTESRELSSLNRVPILTLGNKVRIEITGISPDTDTTKTKIKYQVMPSTEAQNCPGCTATLTPPREVIVNVQYSSDVLKDSEEAIQTAIEEDYAKLQNQETTSVADNDDSATEDCSSMDYRDGKQCFKKQFELAKNCERSSYNKNNPGLCEDIDLQDTVDSFKDWASELAMEEDLSIGRLTRLKDITRNAEVSKHIQKLVQLKTKYEQWKSYNQTFSSEMSAIGSQIEDLNSQISSSTNEMQKQQLIIKRKQLITDAEAGAQKYQRYFSAAFPSATIHEIQGADALLENITTGYNDTLSPFSQVISKQSLLTLNTSGSGSAPITFVGDSASSTADSPSASPVVDLTSERQSRGYVEGFDYSSLLSNFSSQNKSAQMTYSSQYPYVSRSNSQTRNFTGRFNHFRPNGSTMSGMQMTSPTW